MKRNRQRINRLIEDSLKAFPRFPGSGLLDEYRHGRSGSSPCQCARLVLNRKSYIYRFLHYAGVNHNLSVARTTRYLTMVAARFGGGGLAQTSMNG